MNLYVALAVSAAIAAGGAWGGAALADAHARKDLRTCASGIKANNITKCPVEISQALLLIQNKQQQDALAARDKAAPIAAHAVTEARVDAARLAVDVAAIMNEAKTDACASSPAMQLVRRQLCDEVGGASCDRPEGQAQH